MAVILLFAYTTKPAQAQGSRLPAMRHRSQTEPFLELEKTCCVIYFN